MRRTAIAAAAMLAVLLCGCSDTAISEVNSGGGNISAYDSENENISCEELALIAIDSGVFPDMVKVTEQALLDTVMDFSQYGIDEFSVYQQAISVELSEIVVVHSKQPDKTEAALTQRREALIKQYSFYPEQKESAENSIVFSLDGYSVLIAAKEPSAAVEAVKTAISAV
ncbi:MAG: DUF4358 domain-containing protein [Ruminiclostridium sp.]|nr:DUF4358 domain-containing protein [Ruminiclostridium sp.]